MADERGAHELLQRTRAARAPLPRWLWIVSLVVGVACAGGFAIAMLSTPVPAEHQPPPRTHESPSSGFSFNMILFGAGGVAIGWAIARRTQS